MGRLERDITKAVAGFAFGLIAVGAAVAIAVDVLWHRHRR